MPLFRRKKDLIIAAQNGDLEKVKECLDGDAGQVKQAANYCEILDGYEGWTPLHHACNSHGHRRDEKPRADLRNYVQIVEALLAAGADMNSTSSPGILKTPLDFAWAQADFSLLEVLIKKCREKLSPISLLCTACAYVRLDMVTLLLDEGVDVNLTDEHGFTPLHRACLENLSTRSDRDGEIVQMLLNKGADITVTDPSGATAPDLAFSYASVRVVEVLLKEHPELITAQALHKAALHDRFETVELLVDLHKVDGRCQFI